jgi:hypothetical protein
MRRNDKEKIAIYEPRRVTKLSRSWDVATASTNLRFRSVTIWNIREQNVRHMERKDGPRAKMFVLRNCSRSVSGVRGVMVV